MGQSHKKIKHKYSRIATTQETRSKFEILRTKKLILSPKLPVAKSKINVKRTIKRFM